MKLRFPANKEGKTFDFAEKILSGLMLQAKKYADKKVIKNYHSEMVKRKVIVPFITSTDRFERFPPMQHCIVGLRTKWKVGDEIEFLAENRTNKSKTIEFAPKGKVEAVQYVLLDKSDIKENSYVIMISNDQKDWSKLSTVAKVPFVKSCGFASAKDLFEYAFGEDDKKDVFKGKLVHWTDTAYEIEVAEEEVLEETVEIEPEAAPEEK